MLVEFRADIVHLDGLVVLSVGGEIDLATAPDLCQKMEEAIALSPHLVLDLADTTFMDSTGLTALVQARRACLSQGGSVTIRSPQRAVRRVLEITQLDSLITIEG
jgi:anti-sigma B factor antagonist